MHINQRGLPLGDDVRVDQLASQVGWSGAASAFWCMLALDCRPHPCPLCEPYV